MAEVLKKFDLAEIAGSIGYEGARINRDNFKGKWIDSLTLDKDRLREILLANASELARVGHLMFRHPERKEATEVDVVNSSEGPLGLKCTYVNPGEFKTTLSLPLPKTAQAMFWQRESLEIASFNLLHQHGAFSLRHRFVTHPCRKMGLGNIFLEANEAFAKAWAEMSGGNEEIYVSTCQLNVLLWLLKNGYEPRAQDKELLDWILTYKKGAEPKIAMATNSDFTARDYWMKIPDGSGGGFRDLRVILKKSFESSVAGAGVERIGVGTKEALWETVSL